MKTRQGTVLTLAVGLLTLCGCSPSIAETPAPIATSPSDEAAAAAGGRDGEPHVEGDGRSYSYKRTISMEVPEHWYYRETLFDALAQSGEDSPTDFVGIWIPDGNETTGANSIMILHLQATPGLTAEASMSADVGSIGNVTTDEQGRTLTVVDAGYLSLDEGTPVSWIDAELDNGDGYPYVQRTYVFDSPQGGYVWVTVSTVAFQEADILAEVEAALGSIETYALP